MADFDKARPPATELVKFDKNRLIDFERIPDLKTLQEEERKKLQGKWQATRMENSVQGVANAEVLKKVQCDFVGDNFTEIQGDTVEKSQFVLDPTKMPKQITLTWKDDRKNKIKALGIYEFNGDRLRICTSIVEGKPRPTSFTVTKENQVTLCEYDRIPYTIRDLKDLAGEWKYSVMEDGKELSGGTMDIYRDVIWQTDEGQTEKAIVSLDSEKGFLDITPLTGPSAAPRKPLLGRFTWKDGILTIYSGDPGAERPAEAKAGKGVMVAVMVRVVKK